jgi:recombinational DNA repair protein RecR
MSKSKITNEQITERKKIMRELESSNMENVCRRLERGAILEIILGKASTLTNDQLITVLGEALSTTKICKMMVAFIKENEDSPF